MLKKLTAALLFCLASPLFQNAHADELKVGYVNIERVIREAPIAIMASKKMEQEFESRRLELQRFANDLNSRQSALADKRSTLSESQRRQKESELVELSTSFQRRQQNLQEDIATWQNEATSAILEKANKATSEIAESEHLDIILQEAVFVSNQLDITDKVIKKLSGD